MIHNSKESSFLNFKSTRDGFGEGLAEAGEIWEEVVVLTADLEESTRVTAFAKKFPERFFEVGVAEQALVTIASGMANYGKIPVVTSFGVFVPGRCLEQIRTTVAINNLPVVIVGSHAGFSAGADGATHQALEDIAVMRSLPNMTVISPADFFEAKKAVAAAVRLKKPVYLRLERNPTPLLTQENYPFQIEKADFLVKSKDPQVTLIATGPILSEAVKAACELERKGIESQVINCHTLKPFDYQTIITAAKITGAVVTIEVHQKAGGLGSAVSEVLAENFPVPLEMVAVDDAFGESGAQDVLLKKFHLTAEDIVQAAKRAIVRKRT